MQRPPHRAELRRLRRRARYAAGPTSPGPSGSIEIKSGPLAPESLYEAQVVDRLRNT